MNKYIVNLSEKCYGLVLVEAENEEQAHEKAEEAIANGTVSFGGKVEVEVQSIEKVIIEPDE